MSLKLIAKNRAFPDIQIEHKPWPFHTYQRAKPCKKLISPSLLKDSLSVIVSPVIRLSDVLVLVRPLRADG